jgi:hypothetical protein
MRFTRIALVATLLLPTLALAQEPVDTAAVRRIREEAFERGQVMDIASWLTDVYGPRLTGSPITKTAGEWAIRKLTEWGLKDARLESWGPFGRGWTNERMVVQVTAPIPFPVLAYPAAWTPGTNGAVSGKATMVTVDSEPDFEKYRGKLRGAIVLLGRPREVKPSFTPLASRLGDEELAKMAASPAPPPQPPFNIEQMRARMAAGQAFAVKRAQFFRDEGVIAMLQQGRGDGGTVFMGGGGSRDPANPSLLPVLVLASEHYGRIARTLEKGVAVMMDLDVRNSFYDQDQDSFNVLAEIPGTDKDRKGELVMLGGHFDSWHTGTGATDNAAGSAVMMEAVRILKALNLPMKRTVRIGLWTGEEQGLLGSRAYVDKLFGPSRDSLTQPAVRFSGYFNVDNGTGAIRGVYLQGNSAVAPVFEAWMKPFADKGMKTLTLQNTGGTDHLSFDALGLPGFQFIQDPVEYGTRTHHSNMDTWDRLQADDMKLNAAVVAAFVYLTANRTEPLPRKAGLTP